MKSLIRETIARGDIDGLTFMKSHGLCSFDDEDYCEVAAAAGQLDALRWLREKENCPWNATEVHKEASENFHTPVMLYVEVNAQDNVSKLYGEGMPWS